jgi:hypothetical protein
MTGDDYRIEDEYMANCPHEHSITLCERCGAVLDNHYLSAIETSANGTTQYEWFQGDLNER